LDLLLLQLLCDVGDAAAVEALVCAADTTTSSSSSNMNPADVVGVGFRAAAVADNAAERALKAAGRFHALALLYMSMRRSQEALDVWKVRSQWPCLAGNVPEASGVQS
jgi:hypothetical protein